MSVENTQCNSHTSSYSQASLLNTMPIPTLIDFVLSFLRNNIDGNAVLTFVMVIWLAGISSAFVDNIPVTTTMISLIYTLNGELSIAASFGG